MKPTKLLLSSIASVAVLTAIVLTFVGCNGGSSTGSGGTSPGGGPVKLIGAGSSFVNPAMMTWKASYQTKHSDVSLNYQAVGSSAGIGNYKDGLADFGATDAPLTDADLKGMPKPTLQFPVTAGCEVIVYNLPGVGNGLKLTGEVVADIFLGKIKAWNDPAIAGLNPELKLPSTPINVAHRSDGSGTTYIFTDYLSHVSPAWKNGPGQGKTVTWPTGTGGKGNDGVAGVVKQTPGSIGYVELAYAVQTKLTYGPIKNHDGNFVLPTVEATAAAVSAAASALKADNRTSIVDQAGKDVYPICGMTYVLVPAAPADKAKGAAMVDFFKWVLADEQDQAKSLQYAPLPSEITSLDSDVLAKVQTK